MLSFSRQTLSPCLARRPCAAPARAVAWIIWSNSASSPGENSSRRSGAISIGTPSCMIAVFSSAPSLDGEAPRNSLSAWLSLSVLKVYWRLCKPWSKSFLTSGYCSALVFGIGSAAPQLTPSVPSALANAFSCA
jgi:hypothetical protein